MKRALLGTAPYAKLRAAYRIYLSTFQATWKPGYHFVDCPVHPRADAIVMHNGEFQCGVCSWNAWISKP